MSNEKLKDKSKSSAIGLESIIGSILPPLIACAIVFGIGQYQLYYLVAIAFGLNFISYIYAAINATEKFYDFTGALTFIICTLYSLYSHYLNYGHSIHIRNLLLSVCVLIWSGRLGYFLFGRMLKEKEDKRFRKVKTNPAKFLVFWSVQGLWCFLTALPVYFINVYVTQKNNPSPLNLYDVIGLIIWFCALKIEAIADTQKFEFRSKLENKDKFINNGLWYYSRHPNYFGECVLHFGLYLSAMNIFSNVNQYLTIIGPIFDAAVILFLSGIPLLEQSADKKWGEQKDYQEYKKNTPILVPNPFKK